MSDWQPSELVKLKELAGQGLSAGLIAAHLNRQFGKGRSRQAVIGKIHRGEGLFGWLTPRPRLRADGKRRAKPGPKPRTADLPRPLAEKTVAAIAAAFPVAGLPELPPAKAVTVSPDCKGYSVPATRPMRFVDAMIADRCLHFVGDPYGPAGPDMPVCGAERAEGVLNTRYCRRHLASQHQPRDVA